MADDIVRSDSEVVAAVERLRLDHDLLGSRLEELERRRGEISPEVFERVRGDYESRRRRVAEELGPLEARVRSALEDLVGLESEQRRTLRETCLEREEVILRHQLGEIDEVARVARIEDTEARIEVLEGEVQRLAEAAARLRAALGEETPPPPAPPCTAGRPGDDETTRPSPATPSSSDSRASTVVLSGSRLEVQRGEEGEESHTLGLHPVPIGRAPDNVIHLPERSVSRYHAVVSPSREGYLLRDLGSENGTYVNGERVTERLLEPGDTLLLGTVRIVFQ